MAIATFGELASCALDYADHPKDGMDEAEKKRFYHDLNDGISALWKLLIDSHQVFLHKVADPIQIVSGTEYYSLPTDFLRAMKVWYVVNDRRYKMRRYNVDEIDGYPKPIMSGTVELWYAPRAPTFTDAHDPIPSSIPQEYITYAALHAAERILGLEEDENIQWVQGERDRIQATLLNTAGERDEGDPQAIGDFYGRWDKSFIMRDFIMRELRYRIVGDKLHFVEIMISGV